MINSCLVQLQRVVELKIRFTALHLMLHLLQRVGNLTHRCVFVTFVAFAAIGELEI